MEKAAIGYPCQVTAQCLGGSQCSYGVCQCPAGQTAVNGVCSGGSGVCPSNQVLIYNQCLPMVAVGGRCTYEQQCTGYSECYNGYCRCPNGSTPSSGICDIHSSGCKAYQISLNNQCLDKMSIGQSCTNNAQCIGMVFSYIKRVVINQ
ncbi:EB module [Oesophagostomum dentatum]|uniref:EB module n=1 Tax=Oesophagostomum dentatum TaxID=61180 RepID=A0A0B1T6H1_OESDE|nr:EB module [Oesophagostomum dentatum]